MQPSKKTQIISNSITFNFWNNLFYLFVISFRDLLAPITDNIPHFESIFHLLDKRFIG